MWIVAHQGNSAEAPGNSLLAIQQAIDLGVNCIEIDLRGTADGVPVLLHDETYLNRPINEWHVQEVPELVTLEEAFSMTKGRCDLMLDIKAKGLSKTVLETVGLSSNVLLGSLYPSVLSEYVGPLPRERLIAIIEFAEDFPHFSGFPVTTYAIEEELATSDKIKELQILGMQVWVWTVDELEKGKTFIESGVNGLITNNPRQYKSF